ncbi:hypothetical protein OQA88_11641 [Cercophora sp. LCS_1]
MSAQLCRSCNKAPSLNPSLCNSCQPWNNLTHFPLCDRGDSLAFRHFYYTGEVQQPGRAPATAPIDDLEGLAYQSVDAYQSRPRCILCRVLGHLFGEYEKESAASNLQFGFWKPATLRYADSGSKHHGQPDENDLYSTTEICILPVAIRTRNNGEYAYKTIVLKLALGFADSQFGLQVVKPWTPRPTLPFAKITRWLANCTANHGDRCNDYAASMAHPPGLWLIDTLTRCIVMPTNPVPYIALPYCWASPGTTPQSQSLQLLLSNVSQLSQPQSLTPNVLPLVLADAIQLCQDLSHRYLWIDALCIIQDDPASKGSQIAAMDRIYHMALLTIVALSSTPPGLPGPFFLTHSSPFSPWPGFLDAILASASTPEASWAVASSRWDTRGWTFQERKLSRRMLLVDATESYLCCARGTFWESDSRVELDIETAGRSTEDGEDKMDTIEEGLYNLGEEGGEETFGAYAWLVEGYSVRQLSFRSDVVNAFMGVGNILAARMGSGMLWGVLERWLMMGLLWRGRCAKGRDGDGVVPSRSWAAWEGKVDYGLSEVGSLVKFWYAGKRQDGSVVVGRVEEGRVWFSPWQDFWDDVEFEEHFAKTWNRHWENPGDVHGTMVNDTWDRCYHNPRDCLQRVDISDEARAKAQTVPGVLVFTTTITMLTLRHTTRKQGNELPKDVVCFDMVHFGRSFLGGELFVGQTMPIDREWVAKTLDLSHKYRLMVLGAGVANEVRERTYGSWKGCGGGQFPAIGVVNLLAWTQVKPVWESVVLG